MPINYQLGKIYTLVNDLNDTIYVGSTSLPWLSSRMCTHRRQARDVTRNAPIYTAMRGLGSDHFKIVLHHAFACNSRDELIAEEYRTLDIIIAAGQKVYNSMVQGRHSQEAREKIAKSKIGKPRSDETKQKMSEANFAFGSLTLMITKSRGPQWRFRYYDATKSLHCHSFSVAKYGDFGAHFRAEEARRAVYPEWGNDEDIACDDLGHIEWE